MTFEELNTIKKECPNTEWTITNAISASKELLAQHRPYSVRVLIDGTQAILFNTHFINVMRQAMTDGCTARMSKLELAFWLDFVAYQNDIQDGSRDDEVGTSPSDLLNELALEELSRWMVDEIAGTPHQEEIDCYVPYPEL